MNSRYIVKKSKLKKPSNSILAQKRQQKQNQESKKEEDDDSEESLIIRPSNRQLSNKQPSNKQPPNKQASNKQPPNKQSIKINQSKESSPISSEETTSKTKDTTSKTKDTTSKTKDTTSKTEKKEGAEKKKVKVGKETIKRAVEIIKELDPKQEKSLLKLEAVLRKKLQDGVDNLLDYGAIQYLLESFDLDNKLEDWEENRKEQDVKYKAKKLKKEVFHGRVNLDLPKSERLPDENDRIYKTGKNVYSGSQQKYKNPKLQDRKKIQAFKNFSANKRDPKVLKKFGI